MGHTIMAPLINQPTDRAAGLLAYVRKAPHQRRFADTRIALENNLEDMHLHGISDNQPDHGWLN